MHYAYICARKHQKYFRPKYYLVGTKIGRENKNKNSENLCTKMISGKIRVTNFFTYPLYFLYGI